MMGIPKMSSSSQVIPRDHVGGIITVYVYKSQRLNGDVIRSYFEVGGGSALWSRGNCGQAGRCQGSEGPQSGIH